MSGRRILNTGDGGSTWNAAPMITSYGITDIHFFNRDKGIETEHNYIPNKYFLSQNFPNPFNPSTKIRYSIPQTTFVSLKIYDILGNEIAALVNEEKQIGNYEVEFKGDRLSSGIYFYNLKAGEFSETKKMIILK